MEETINKPEEKPEDLRNNDSTNAQIQPGKFDEFINATPEKQRTATSDSASQLPSVTLQGDLSQRFNNPAFPDKKGDIGTQEKNAVDLKTGLSPVKGGANESSDLNKGKDIDKNSTTPGTSIVETQDRGSAASAVKTGDTNAVKIGDATAVKTGDATAVKTGDANAVKTGDTNAEKIGDATAVKTGDATAVKTGDATAVKTGDATAVKTGDATAEVENKKDSKDSNNKSESVMDRLVANGLSNLIKQNNVPELENTLRGLAAERPESINSVMSQLQKSMNSDNPPVRMSWESGTKSNGEPFLRMNIKAAESNKPGSNSSETTIGSDGSRATSSSGPKGEERRINPMTSLESMNNARLATPKESQPSQTKPLPNGMESNSKKPSLDFKDPAAFQRVEPSSQQPKPLLNDGQQAKPQLNKQDLSPLANKVIRRN